MTSLAVRTGLTRAQLHALTTVWITYGTFYFCRVNIGPARSEIESQLLLSPFEMGLVLASLKVGYAFGQLLNGALVERFGARRVLLVGMIGSVAMTFLFAASPEIASSPAFASILPSVGRGVSSVVSALSIDAPVGPLAALLVLVWLTNGVFQAGGWPSTVKVMPAWFSVEQRGRIMGVVGTSYQLGSAVTIFGVGLLVSQLGWRGALLVPGALFFLSAIHTAWRIEERPHAGEAPHAPESIVAPRLPVGRAIALTLSNPKIWILAFALFGLDIVRYGFLDWVPGHLKSTGSGAVGAALKAAVFPLAGAAGALVSGWASDRWFGSRRAPVIAGALVLTASLTFAYPEVVPWGDAATVTCLALAGFFVYGAHILLVGTAAQDFARAGATAAAAGFVDFVGNLGAFSGDFVTGWLLRDYDWHAAIRYWAIAALVAAGLVSLLWNARGHRG